MRKALFIGLLGTGMSLACHHPKSTMSTNTTDIKASQLNGTWEANYVAGGSFDALYPNAKPTITFNSEEKRVAGVTGCNNFMGGYTQEGNQLRFGGDMVTTRKMCPDMKGEELFLETLKKVNSCSVSGDGNTLNLVAGDIAVMRLTRK